jgi:hypothetical protein
LRTRLGDRSVVNGGEVGVGLFDGLGICLALGVVGERPVDACDAGVLALALAGGAWPPGGPQEGPGVVRQPEAPLRRA